MRNRVLPAPLAAAMLAYVVVFSTLCILRYTTCRYGDPDFGVFEQSFWTAAREGMPFFNSFEGGSHFRTHNSPVFFLLLPFYMVAPAMQTLLLLQVIAVALGAWPVYLLGRHFLGRPPFERLEGERAGCWLGVIYLLYHPLHGVTYDQFNELAFVPAPLLFAFYFLHTRRWGLFWLSAMVAMAAKEDMTFVVAGLGLYAAALGFRRAGLRSPGVVHGLAMAAVAGLWLWVTLQLVFPYYRGGEEWPYFSHRYGHLGANLAEVVGTLATRPGVVLPYLVQPTALALALELLVPLALIPLLAPEVLAVAAPTWFIVCLSDFEGTRNTGSRYLAPVVAVLLVALTVGVRRLALRGRGAADWPRLRRVLAWPLVLALLSSLLLNNTPLRFPFRRIPLPDEHLRQRQALLDLLPDKASVSTQADFYGHVAHRVEAYIGFREGVDYLLVDPGQPFSNWYVHAGWSRALRPLVESGRYVRVQERDGAALYRRADLR